MGNILIGRAGCAIGAATCRVPICGVAGMGGATGSRHRHLQDCPARDEVRCRPGRQDRRQRRGLRVHHGQSARSIRVSGRA